MDEGPVNALLIKILRKRFSRGTSSHVGEFLHPSPVQNSRSIWQTVQLFLKSVPGFYLCWQFGCGTSLCFTDQEAQEEMFEWNQLPCGPVLTPISCTKLKIHSAHADSPIVHKSVVFIYVMLAIWMWDQSMLHGSTNSRRDVLVEPAPLWASSYTHLRYKAQDPFSTC